MKARKKKTSGLDMIKPTSFYSSESEKIKLNWFCYEFSMAIYDGLEKKNWISTQEAEDQR